MNNLTASIAINLDGNMIQQGRRMQQAMNDLSRTGRTAMRGLGTGVGYASQKLDGFGNRYVGLATGAGAAAVGRWMVNEQRRFTRLGIQANQSSEQIAKLKGQIYDTARAPEIRVDAGQIVSAIEEIVEKTGDLKFAQENIRNIGLALSATGGDGGAIGGIFAEFQKIGITRAQDVMQAIDLLNKQGKAGAFTLENLASLGPRVVSAYASTGRGGLDMIREMGAVLQVIRQGTGSSEQAATAFEALIRTLLDAKKSKMLQQGGIKIFDPEALKKGEEVMRPLNEIMVEIVKASKGRASILSQVFDAEAMRSFNAVAGEFIRTGNVESLQKFIDIQADGSTTLRDSARAAHDAAGGLSALATSSKIFADEKLAPAFLQFTEALNKLDNSTVDKWLKIGGAFALIYGGNKVARTGLDAMKYLGVPALPVAVAVGSGIINNVAGSFVDSRHINRSSTDKLLRERDALLSLSPNIPGIPPIPDKRIDDINAELQRRQFEGQLHITVSPDGSFKVNQLSSSPGFDIDVDSGQMMRGH